MQKWRSSIAKCKNCRNGAYLKDAYGDGYYWCFELEEDFGEDRIVMPCHAFIPKTNADRIRSMTDEELAELLDEANCIIECSKCDEPTNEWGSCIGDCKKPLLRWLKSEVWCE